ncbi:OFA family MFS transporter [Thermosipho ferrireducens]|uniref:OFA family MFS transporter n=1 Tax=Thermosipho ferrireducens TaxID=2571116 RepID=A0ABX7S518_9BACT|nr:OFA family MFS transporter [Thermosipho ferrireducens]QTA37587.1 OFA family MFS transporter [Thermosipho ferrireducens]
MEKYITENLNERYFRIRWKIPLAGFLLALMGGLSYAWGVFIVPLVERFGWSTTEATLPFTVFMVIFALTMVPAGKLQDMWGPKKVSAIGTILFFLAYISASFVGHFPYSWWLIITYGIIGGISCGLTYACVAPPIRKFFPDKPGMAVSFGVMGFGLAALMFAPLKAGYLIPNHGIEGTFVIIGISTLIVLSVAVLLIENPPENWKLPDSVLKKVKSLKHPDKPHNEVPPTILIKTPIFYVMWLVLALVVTGGMLSMKLIPPYGELILGLSSMEAAWAIAIFSGVNGLGRPLAGFLSDKLGVLRVMITTYIMQMIILILFPVFVVTFPMLCIAAAITGWGFAVTLALFPVLTAEYFGTKNLGVNYGLVFTAFGVGAISPTIGAWIYDMTGSYFHAFISAGILSGIGALLCMLLLKKLKPYKVVEN